MSCTKIKWQIIPDTVFFQDPRTEIQSLSKFLGRSLNDAQINDVVHHCSFEEMKANEKTNFSEFQTIGFIDMKVMPFMRSGKLFFNLMEGEHN